MKNFNWVEFKKGMIAVHCDTEEKAIDFLSKCKENDVKWHDGGEIEPDKKTNFENYKNKTCYSFDCFEFGFADLAYHQKYFEIIKWEIDKMEKKVYKIQDLFNDKFVGKKFKTNLGDFDNNLYEITKQEGSSGLVLYKMIDKHGVDIGNIYNLNALLKFEFELVEEEVKKPKTKGYLANGLFSLGDRLVNELLAAVIRETIAVDLYNPQENLELNNKQAYADSKQIYEGDYDYLKETDFLVSVIDGCEIDSGTAAEIAIVSTMNKPIYALYTDNRQQGTENQKKIEALVNDPTENQFMYRNLFVVGLIKKHGYIFDNIEDLVKQLKEDINNKKLERVK